MGTILIADRDQTERFGIRWFIQSNRIHFDRVSEAGNLKDAVEYIKMYKPDVVCIELEMVPPQYMRDIALLLRQHARWTICLTAEPVYERALQAIEFHGRSLLVKPLSPE